MHVLQISLRVKVPAFLDVASYDLRWTERFDELEGKTPRMQNIWRFNLLDPVSCVNSHIFEHLLHYSACQRVRLSLLVY